MLLSAITGTGNVTRTGAQWLRMVTVRAGRDSLTADVEDEIRAVCRELLASPESPGIVHQRLTTILVCILTESVRVCDNLLIVCMFADECSRTASGHTYLAWILLSDCVAPVVISLSSLPISFTVSCSTRRYGARAHRIRMPPAAVLHTGGGYQSRSRAHRHTLFNSAYVTVNWILAKLGILLAGRKRVKARPYIEYEIIVRLH